MFDTEAELWHLIELPISKPRLWHSACLSLYNEVLVYGGCTSNILDLDRKPVSLRYITPFSNIYIYIIE